MSKGVKRVALLKHKEGFYLYDHWRGNAYMRDDIIGAKQFSNAAAAKGVRTRLKNGNEFTIVFATVTIEEEAE